MATTSGDDKPNPLRPGRKWESQRLKLPLLDLPTPETDTLIYLSPISAPSPPIRCSSQKLLATKSPIFERLLGATCQYRLLRRKGLLKAGLPMGIKFVVDLSPPEEGDEAVDVVERLWCPDSILSYTSQLAPGFLEPDEPADKPPAPPTLCMDEFGACITPPRPALLGYSPTRHTAAIERVLHILHGLDPRIHTTPMWYTVHKVAIQLECTQTVQDHIISWLYGNLDFVESNPGLILQIADEIKNPDLFRDAFAILVGSQLIGGQIGESAVFNLNEAIPVEAEPWSKHIGFARRSLQDRLGRLYDYIESTAWLEIPTLIPEYAKLAAFLPPPSCTTPTPLQQLSSTLDTAIRKDISSALSNMFTYSENPSYDNINPWHKAVFDMIPRSNQIYSRVYWVQLRSLARRGNGHFTMDTMGLLWRWELAVKMHENEEEPFSENQVMLDDTQPDLPSSKKTILEVRETQPGTSKALQELCEVKKATQEKRTRKRRSKWGKWGKASDSWPGPSNASSESLTPLLSQTQGAKRKSIEKDLWLDGISNFDNQESVVDAEEYEDTLPPVGRIEISNPIAKRHCSVDRSTWSGEEEEAQPEISGEPEMNEKGKGKARFAVTGLDMSASTQSVSLKLAEEKFEAALQMLQVGTRIVKSSYSTVKSGYGPGHDFWNPDDGTDDDTDKGKGKVKTKAPAPIPIPNATETQAHEKPLLGPYRNTTLLIDEPEPDARASWLSDFAFKFDEELDAGPSSVQQVTMHTLPEPYGPYTYTPPGVTQDKINTTTLWEQCNRYLKAACAGSLKVPTSFDPSNTGDGQVLVCLLEDEWKYMPMWAGGLDDGSGAVFGELVVTESVVQPAFEEEAQQGDETEVESLVGSYDDCMDLESIGSFETGGFSEFGSVAGAGTVISLSDFGGDSEADAGSDVETRVESEVESLGESTEDESGDEESSDDFGWESA